MMFYVMYVQRQKFTDILTYNDTFNFVHHEMKSDKHWSLGNMIKSAGQLQTTYTTLTDSCVFCKLFS